MVSQVLFGEMVKLIDRKNKSWVKIQCLWDDYVGWTDPKLFEKIDENEVNQINSQYAVSLEVAHPIISDERSLTITLGSSLPHYDGISKWKLLGCFVLL